MNQYLEAHIERVVESTKNLYEQPGSICKKCHNTDKDIYCLFCYCPRYWDLNCGGNYTILPNGLKDCSYCMIPHTKEFCANELKKIYGV
jgi:Zn-finger protein